jgi:hypothetical protein
MFLIPTDTTSRLCWIEPIAQTLRALAPAGTNGLADQEPFRLTMASLIFDVGWQKLALLRVRLLV